MPSTSRVVVPGMPHHVVQRGSRRLNVFRDEEDRVTYLELIAESCAQSQVAVRAWALMPNHVHYMVWSVSCVLSDARLRNAIRYVENNPVRAGMVSEAREYRWSSARAHCHGDADLLLAPDEPRAIKGWPEWLNGKSDRVIDDLIRECTFTGRPCGDETFVLELERLTGRRLRPKKPGPKPRVNISDTPSLNFRKQ